MAPTVCGILALLFWSADGLLVSHLLNIPAFEIISIIFTVAFALMAAKLSISKQWHKIKQPLSVWVIGTCSIYGNIVFYMLSFKYAPPQQVLLIYFLWPIFALLLSTLLAKKRLMARQVIALLLGFSALVALNFKHATLHINAHVLIGYCYAFIAAVIWSCYIVHSKKRNHVPVEMVGMYFGLGAILSFAIMAHQAHWVMPNPTQVIGLILMGLLTQGLAYFLWQTGIQHGHFHTLNTLSYSVPILAVIWLILGGITHTTIHLLIATTLVTLSVILATTKRLVFNKKSIGSETCTVTE